MARVLDLVKGLLFFFAAYLAIGTVWYGLEETISPLAGLVLSNGADTDIARYDLHLILRAKVSVSVCS